MFCPDFCVAGANEQTGQNETATSKIYAMPKTDCKRTTIRTLTHN